MQILYIIRLNQKGLINHDSYAIFVKYTQSVSITEWQIHKIPTSGIISSFEF